MTVSNRGASRWPGVAKFTWREPKTRVPIGVSRPAPTHWPGNRPARPADGVRRRARKQDGGPTGGTGVYPATELRERRLRSARIQKLAALSRVNTANARARIA